MSVPSAGSVLLYFTDFFEPVWDRVLLLWMDNKFILIGAFGGSTAVVVAAFLYLSIEAS